MNLTVDVVAATFPANLKKLVNQELVDKLNSLGSDPDFTEQFKNNFLSYSRVLVDSRYTIQQYLNAVQYVTHKLLGASNREAYIKVFPDRYAHYLSKKTSSRDIDSIVSAYNRTQLVNAVFEQVIIPSWILNQDAYQSAINTQVELMASAKSEMVRCKAADSLLTHLQKPEAITPLVQVEVKDSGLNELKNTLIQLAQQQRALITSGATTKEVVEQNLITGVSYEQVN